MTQAHPHEVSTCPACRLIDKIDGLEDGEMFRLGHWEVASEHQRFERLRAVEDRTADRITKFAGSLKFVYLHTVWFGVWIALNVGLIGLGAEFDKFPFGLLTMIVSLEAIFLATFVMVSQNRQALRSEVRAQVDFESNLQSLIWSIHIGQKLGLDIEHIERLCRDVVGESRAKR
jgi:uncharacterized membrane protein